MAIQILYTDDELDACELGGDLLRSGGYEVVTETSPARAVELGCDTTFDIVITDLHMRGLDGFAVCERLVGARPNLPVIILTGDTSFDTAVGALRAGAYDFVTKPIDPEPLFAALQRAAVTVELRAHGARLEAAIGTARGIGGVLGESAAMRCVFDEVGRMARTDVTVVVTGESGTGKELIARALHDQSRRSGGPFVAINCAAVPAALLESEFFGHARGAFTDAKASRRGLFLDANGGTLFLDEIGDMPLEMQTKLLRALQERTVRAVGGTAEVPFDARIVAATNHDLEAEVIAKRFREDLYYRVHVCGIELPPLRDREGDIPLIATRFVERFAERHQKKVGSIDIAALRKLTAYGWPGNVRELENCIEHAVAMTRTDTIVVDDLPDRIRAYKPGTVDTTLPDSIDEVVSMTVLEERYIDHVLRLVHGNKSRAARLLGFDRRTLYRKAAMHPEHDAEPSVERPVPLPLPPKVPRPPSRVPNPATEL